MDELNLDPKTTALIVVDLQHSVVSRQLEPYPASDVVKKAVLLSNGVRDAGGTVVFVHVDMSGAPRTPVDAPRPRPSSPQPPQASALVPELGVQPQDVIVLKQQPGAFYNTSLEEELRKRGIEVVIVVGIATNLGVESTARGAYDRQFAVIIAEDACTSLKADLHAFAMQRSLPLVARVRSTEQILAALSG